MITLTASAVSFNVVEENPDDPILRVELVYAGTNDQFQRDHFLYDIYVNGMTDDPQSAWSYWHHNRPEGVYRIWVENLGEYYCQYTKDNPYTVSLYKDTLVEIPITNTPTNEYKAIESTFVMGNDDSPGFRIIFGIVAILLVLLAIKKSKI